MRHTSLSLQFLLLLAACALALAPVVTIIPVPPGATASAPGLDVFIVPAISDALSLSKGTHRHEQ